MPSSTTGVLPGADEVELGLVDVHADDAMAVAREARERYRAYVTQTEDADVHSESCCSSSGSRASRAIVPESTAIDDAVETLHRRSHA